MRNFKILEFDKILKKLSSYTDSELVKKRILSLEPEKSAAAARELQRETTEAVSAMLKSGAPPVKLSLTDIASSVKRCDMGSSLNIRELLEVSRCLYAARRMKSYTEETSENSVILRGLGDGIITVKSLEDAINSAIAGDDEIADDASAELAAIRRKMKNLNAKVRDTLNEMIHSSHYRKFLQDGIVTVREERYVIPVRSEYRAEVKGIVHDSSSSGATLFIEPMSVVNMNNEIRELSNREKIETERILAELSAKVAENAEAVTADFDIVTRLDFIFCKGKLSMDYGGTEPELNDTGTIEFKKARHPLINKDTVVANDIYMGDKFDTLVITGPNTGGKTVTLKTLGLFSIMAAAGLHLPVADASRAAVFSNVFADIGDEQSIEQSLSTFSSHMVNIISITENADANSLTLFDELGAGTDPTEGAALAVSVIEYLRFKGCRVAATTHYSELKLYALSTEGVENASCEFDIKSLRPTYKLLIGVPGKSNAFAISRRLGLSEEIISRANEILSDENIKFEDVITELEENRAQSRREREYAERVKREMIDLKNRLDKERADLKDNKSRILEEARREAKIILLDAKDESNRIIKELEELQKSGAKDVGDKVRKAREKLKGKQESIEEGMARAAKPVKTYREPPKNLKRGSPVKIVDMDREAIVIKEPDKNGMVRVQAGIIKMEVHISNLIDREEKKGAETAKQYIGRGFASKAKTVKTEVDVRGQNLEEALMNVEKFLDDCYLAGVSPVTVIHGKGTGVLRSGIGDMLRKHRYVKSHRPGKYGEGENGVTVVELK
ncbi:MAG: endonuclease MutS2 [Oscillospiraceae bacterium]|nr:endonuclease MutS2 [Oscillospiraceae bacterium]